MSYTGILMLPSGNITISGKGRMTVLMPPGKARTMDFNANDVGFVPAVAGHYVENTGRYGSGISGDVSKHPSFWISP